MANGSFFSELKRRNFYRVAAAYVVASWIILQAASILLPVFNAPDWGMRSLSIGLILGFPFIMVVAWIFKLGFGATQITTPEAVSEEAAEQQTSKGLNRFIAIALIVAVLVFFITLFWRIQARQARLELARPMEQSIAVLPFSDLSANKDQEYFADGLAEELLTMLAKVPELKVISRSSAFSFKGQNLDLPTIAQKLHVEHILEGSVRKADNQMRISVQLIKVDGDEQLWAKTWDRELKDIFAIQDEIASQVVSALKLKLLPGSAPKAVETDPQAYAYFIQGKYFYQQKTEEAWQKAEDLYGKALAIDSNYVPALIEQAKVIYNKAAMVTGTFAEKEAKQISKQLTMRALRINDQYAPAYAQLAYLLIGDYDLTAATENINKALALDAGDAGILRTAGVIASSAGNFKDGIEYTKQAIGLDPVSIVSIVNLGMLYLQDNQPAAAESTFRQALALQANPGTVFSFLSIALLLQGKNETALEAAEKESIEYWNWYSRVVALYAAGKKEASDKLLQELIDKYSVGGAFQIAEAYAYRNEREQAFHWLNVAYENHDPGMSLLVGSPLLRSLHEDPRWQALIQKVGFR